MSINTVLPWFHFRRTFRIRVLCRCRHLWILEIICELLQPFWNISLAGFRDRFFLVRAHHFASKLDLMMYLMVYVTSFGIVIVQQWHDDVAIATLLLLRSILWSAVVVSPKIVTRGRWPTWFSGFSLQRALVIFVRLQISQFGSFGNALIHSFWTHGFWRRLSTSCTRKRATNKC